MKGWEGEGLKMFSVKNGSRYHRCLKQNFFAPYLDIIDTGATITLNKIKKANQSNFTIIQSRNIQRHEFETSVIQL